MLVLKDVLTDMAKAIVEKPDSVSVTESAGEDGEILLTLSVDPDDMGKVIGRHGRIAKALRTIMKAAATSVEQKVTVEIEEQITRIKEPYQGLFYFCGGHAVCHKPMQFRQYSFCKPKGVFLC